MVRRAQDLVTHWAWPPSMHMHRPGPYKSFTYALCDNRTMVWGGNPDVDQSGPTCILCTVNEAALCGPS